MAAVSSQPRTARSAGPCRALPGLHRDTSGGNAQRGAAFPQGRRGVPGAHREWLWGTGHSPTPSPGPVPARRARSAGGAVPGAHPERLRGERGTHSHYPPAPLPPGARSAGGAVPGAHPKWLWGTGHSPTPFPRSRSRQALAGPLPPRAPPRPIGDSEAGARQHPNSATEPRGPNPPPVAGAQPRRRAAPSRLSSSFPPLPRPQGPAHRRPIPRGPRSARSHTQPPSRARRAAIRSAPAVT
ncbi:basic proline-rich protein-like [Zonotrichia leucophrys gambelii]|uniref:basic proline-rich protein-like n=1 Tax=Zonotrichia leucophrys gambelii TaxID=257770 RepID=UPI00314041EC